MRLLNVHTLRLESFLGTEKDIPPYAILSHTWETNEIVFNDIQQQPIDRLRQNPTFGKVEQTCLRAKTDQLDYAWIDTCCIDKSSSAELSEAINSMFKYYAQSSKCYVYLSDYEAPSVEHAGRAAQDDKFSTCRWFARGWTLQELIAPLQVEFFDKNWNFFGTRDGDLRDLVCRRTKVWPQVFQLPRCACLEQGMLALVRDGVCVNCHTIDSLPDTLDTFAVSIKMSWAATRETTRTEDAAYCLLGLFNINMPLLYGEGHKAFFRLQEAIVRQSKDQSILLWRAFRTNRPLSSALGCLAPSASFFRDPATITARRVFNNVDRRYKADFLGKMSSMNLTDTALRITVWLCPCVVNAYDEYMNRFADKKLWLAILDLAQDDDYLTRPAILLEFIGVTDLYRRVYNQLIILINPRHSYSSLRISTKQPNEDSDNHSMIKVERDLGDAVQKDIGILLQQSPLNAIELPDPFSRGPTTGPVYLILNRNDDIPIEVDGGGSYPLLSSYEARSSQMAAPWRFQKCECSHSERFFGGIHFIDLVPRPDLPDASPSLGPQRGEIAIIWGMHERHRTADEELDRNPSACPWKPWCRAFDMQSFMKSTNTSLEDLKPNQLYNRPDALSPRDIQRRIFFQRRRLCALSWETRLVQHNHGPKRLFPDSYGEEWGEDLLENVMQYGQFTVDARVKVNRIEGLGRTVYELEVHIEAIERWKRSWPRKNDPPRNQRG